MMNQLQIQWHSEKRKLADLKDYTKNPRKMGEWEFQKLVESLEQDGYHGRIKINLDNTIIGGHQRRNALLKIGMQDSDEIEVLVPDRLLEGDDFDRVNIRDNLPYGAYDFDILANNFEIDQLVDWGMPESWLDFSVDEIDPENAEDGFAGGLKEETIAKPGDIWSLGEHRLMCGDSTNPLHVESLCLNLEPHLMVTDPPYGVNYNPEWREGADLGVGERSKGKVLNDDRVDWSQTYSLFTGDVAYIWHGGLHTHTVAQNIIDCGFNLVTQIIWVKQHFVLSRGDYHWQHEPCWYAVRKGSKHSWSGARDQKTTWEIKNNNSFGNANKEETMGHGTQKPVECMLRPIINNSKPGDYIYDPFGGSGTTLVACEKSKRKCLMMELSPNYVDMVIARWEKLSGDKAILLTE